jgi:hypothetical protein
MSSLGPPGDEAPDRFDAAGKWLADCYQLPHQDRMLVKDATIDGAAVSDPRLQEAVRGLASEILGHRLRLPGIALYYTIGAAGGVVGIGLIANELNALGHHGRHEIVAIVAALVALNHVITYFIYLPRQRRKKVAKALRVNSGGEGLPEP